MIWFYCLTWKFFLEKQKWRKKIRFWFLILNQEETPFYVIQECTWTKFTWVDPIHTSLSWSISKMFSWFYESKNQVGTNKGHASIRNESWDWNIYVCLLGPGVNNVALFGPKGSSRKQCSFLKNHRTQKSILVSIETIRNKQLCGT